MAINVATVISILSTLLNAGDSYIHNQQRRLQQFPTRWLNNGDDMIYVKYPHSPYPLNPSLPYNIPARRPSLPRESSSVGIREWTVEPKMTWGIPLAMDPQIYLVSHLEQNSLNGDSSGKDTDVRHSEPVVHQTTRKLEFSSTEEPSDSLSQEDSQESASVMDDQSTQQALVSAKIIDPVLSIKDMNLTERHIRSWATAVVPLNFLSLMGLLVFVPICVN